MKCYSGCQRIFCKILLHGKNMVPNYNIRDILPVDWYKEPIVATGNIKLLPKGPNSPMLTKYSYAFME